VLNALRHQRNWNGMPAGFGAGFRSAQRLTASKELEPPSWNFLPIASPCAQRLTASKELELMTQRLPSTLICRAQRLTASKELERLNCTKQTKSISCSTPYGIKGIGT